MFSFLFIIIPLLFSFASAVTLSSSYKSYRESYRALSTGVYKFSYKEHGTYYYKKSEDNDYTQYLPFMPSSTITYSEITGDLQLLNRGYIQHNFITYMDPYSVYWLMKYKKWFKKYKGIEDYKSISRDSKLEELLNGI